jgi:hypothetical protein
MPPSLDESIPFLLCETVMRGTLTPHHDELPCEVSAKLRASSVMRVTAQVEKIAVLKLN